MRHRVKRVRFGQGVDAARSIERKMLRNFILAGRLTSTHNRVKLLKSSIETLMTYAKSSQASAKNVLVSRLGDRKIVQLLSGQIAPIFKERTGGYVRIVKLGYRASDGANAARLEWTVPIVLEKAESKKKEPKAIQKLTQKKLKVGAKPTPVKKAKKTKKS